jgi:hypothetical protein
VDVAAAVVAGVLAAALGLHYLAGRTAAVAAAAAAAGPVFGAGFQ